MAKPAPDVPEGIGPGQDLTHEPDRQKGQQYISGQIQAAAEKAARSHAEQIRPGCGFYKVVAAVHLVAAFMPPYQRAAPRAIYLIFFQNVAGSCHASPLGGA